jgi:hypothetical protein
MTNSIRDILDNYYQQRTLDLIKQKTSFAKVGEEAKPALWYTETEQAINAYISTAVREARLEEMQERPDSIKFDYDHDRIAQLKEEGTVEPAPVKPFNGTPASKLTGTDITLVEGYNMTEPNLDKIELCVVDVFFNDLILDMVAKSEPITRKELYVKLEELRTKLKELGE